MWAGRQQAVYREWSEALARLHKAKTAMKQLAEPRSDRRCNAEASPARELTSRPGRGERDMATGGRKGNRVAVLAHWTQVC